MIAEVASALALALASVAWWRSRLFHWPLENLIDVVASRAASRSTADVMKALRRAGVDDAMFRDLASLRRLPKVLSLRERNIRARQRIRVLELYVSGLVAELKRTEPLAASAIADRVGDRFHKRTESICMTAWFSALSAACPAASTPERNAPRAAGGQPRPGADGGTCSQA